MKESIILVDCDGVLLNWEYAFEIWMTQHGFEFIPGGELNYDIEKIMPELLATSTATTTKVTK